MSVWLGKAWEALTSVTVMGRMTTAAALWSSGPDTDTSPVVALMLQANIMYPIKEGVKRHFEK